MEGPEPRLVSPELQLDEAVAVVAEPILVLRQPEELERMVVETAVETMALKLRVLLTRAAVVVVLVLVH